MMNAIKLEAIINQLQAKVTKDEIEINELKDEIIQIKSKVNNISKI